MGLARAEAEATQVVAEAAARHGQAGLRYFISDRYIQAFQALAAARTPANDGADGMRCACRRHHPGDAVSARRQQPAGQRTIRAAATIRTATPAPDRAHTDAAARTRARCFALGDRVAGMRDWVIWLVAGLALLGIEIHAPGAFMMWLGLATCGTVVIVLASGIGFELQVVTCAVLAAISLAGELSLRHHPGIALFPAVRARRPRRPGAPPFQGRGALRLLVAKAARAARVPPDVAQTSLRIAPARGAHEWSSVNHSTPEGSSDELG